MDSEEDKAFRSPPYGSRRHHLTSPVSNRGNTDSGDIFSETKRIWDEHKQNASQWTWNGERNFPEVGKSRRQKILEATTGKSFPSSLDPSLSREREQYLATLERLEESRANRSQRAGVSPRRGRPMPRSRFDYSDAHRKTTFDDISDRGLSPAQFPSPGKGLIAASSASPDQMHSSPGRYPSINTSPMKKRMFASLKDTTKVSSAVRKQLEVGHHPEEGWVQEYYNNPVDSPYPPPPATVTSKAGSIRVSSERPSPGSIRHISSFENSFNGSFDLQLSQEHMNRVVAEEKDRVWAEEERKLAAFRRNFSRHDDDQTRDINHFFKTLEISHETGVDPDLGTSIEFDAYVKETKSLRRSLAHFENQMRDKSLSLSMMSIEDKIEYQKREAALLRQELSLLSALETGVTRVPGQGSAISIKTDVPSSDLGTLEKYSNNPPMIFNFCRKNVPEEQNPKFARLGKAFTSCGYVISGDFDAVKKLSGEGPLHPSTLLCAIRTRKRDIAQFLVERGTDLTVLPVAHEAYNMGDAELLTNMISRNPKCLETLDGDNMTCLDIAVRENDIRAAETFLDKGAFPNPDRRIPVDEYGKRHRMSPLFHAKDTNMLELLLTRGAKPSFCNHDAQPFICAVAGRGAVTVLRKILEETEVDLNAPPTISKSKRRGNYPLCEAAKAGKAETVRIMVVEYGADPNFGDGDYTTLHAAAEYGHTDVVRALLPLGVNLEACEEGGRTALEVAVVNGQLPTAQCLLEHGADPNSSNVPLVLLAKLEYDHRKSPFTEVEFRKHIEDSAKLLIDKGCAVDAFETEETDDYEDGPERGNGQLTALYYSVKSGKSELSRILLGAGADPLITTARYSGENPLYISLKNQASDIAIMIMKLSNSVQCPAEGGVVGAISSTSSHKTGSKFEDAIVRMIHVAHGQESLDWSAEERFALLNVCLDRRYSKAANLFMEKIFPTIKPSHSMPLISARSKDASVYRKYINKFSPSKEMLWELWNKAVAEENELLLNILRDVEGFNISPQNVGKAITRSRANNVGMQMLHEAREARGEKLSDKEEREWQRFVVDVLVEALPYVEDTDMLKILSDFHVKGEVLNTKLKQHADLTLAHLACGARKLKSLTYLLQHGAQFQAQTSLFGNPPGVFDFLTPKATKDYIQLVESGELELAQEIIDELKALEGKHWQERLGLPFRESVPVLTIGPEYDLWYFNDIALKDSPNDHVVMEKGKTMKDYNWLLKYSILGPKGVGKSSLLYKLKWGVEPIDIKSKKKDRVLNHPKAKREKRVRLPEMDSVEVETSQGVNCTLQVWTQTSDLQNYGGLWGTDVVLLLFDVNSCHSLRSLEGVKERFLTYTGPRYPSNVQFHLVGMKTDKKNCREVFPNDGRQWAEERGMTYHEISCVQATKESVTDLFVELASHWVDQRESGFEK